MRITNADALASHGNVSGRRAMVDILEAGLQAGDPYNNARKLVRREGRYLVVGGADYEPRGDPHSGEIVFDLERVRRILVVGAGKGVQCAARAFEDILWSRLDGGHVIAKHGDELLLRRIGVTYGAHPVPDEGCVLGCQRIRQVCAGLTPQDLVFTIVGNGVSSLLTSPAPGVSLEDVRQMTYLMQIDRGAPTWDLNAVRNHLDTMKGGRVSRYIRPAQAVHLVMIDPGTYEGCTRYNLWLHTLPDCTSFADAVAALKAWDAWDEVSPAIRRHLLKADPEQEVVRGEEFERTSARILGLMPDSLGPLPAAMARARELGFAPHRLAQGLAADAGQAGLVMGTIGLTIARYGEPFEPPCALFSSGELLVTVGQEDGIGGRNQEWALSAAPLIAGSEHVVMGGVDTDGTDGPGAQFASGNGHPPCLAGGIVDGTTLSRSHALGLDLRAEMRRHNATPALLRLGSGIVATQNISVGDLSVVLVQARRGVGKPFDYLTRRASHGDYRQQ